MSDLVERLKTQLGESLVAPAEDVPKRALAGHPLGTPRALLRPRSTQDVSIILKACHAEKQPVVPWGGRTGLVEGAHAEGAVALSLERMNRIEEVDEAGATMTVEAGCVLQTVCDAADAKGMFFPLDLGARGSATIGGNIATNAGGPRCLKYGVTRDYVLGLEVVLADGTIIRTGGRTHKNKTGFDLTKLFVGSEGLLGVITEATLKLIPLPPFRATMAVGSMRHAVGALQAILAAGFLPSALELADEFTLAAAAKYTGSKRLGVCKAHLIVELDGQKNSVRGELPAVEKVIRKFKPLFVERGLGDIQCERIWEIRRVFSTSLKSTGLKKLNEDIVVPRGRLEDLFRFTAKLQKKIRLPIACFGHAGDGNIHVNIMLDANDAAAVTRGEAALDELFKQVLAWNGAITGEHGIGLAKKRWWPLAVSPEVRELHYALKHILDPNGILNPGKFVE